MNNEDIVRIAKTLTHGKAYKFERLGTFHDGVVLLAMILVGEVGLKADETEVKSARNARG